MVDQESSYFYYPTTTVIIDDDKEFFDGLSQSLKLYRMGPIRTFVDPQQALSYLATQNSIYQSYQKYLEVIDTIETDNDDKDQMSKINFNSICTLPYDGKRYDEVSVIIVDYFMPQMNGIDFFKNIKNIPAKKILLTVATDYKLAVSAFNDRIIDRFIIKEKGAEEALFKSINSFSKRYFHDFSEALLHVFDKGIKKDVQYTTIAFAWHTKNKITEYYQCDSNGSCFGFDNAGIIHWLLICSDKDMDDYVSIAENSDGGLPIADKLKFKNKLLFFFSEEEKLLPVQEWAKHTFPVDGDFTIDNEKYFFSFVSNKTFDIDLKKVMMFPQF